MSQSRIRRAEAAARSRAAGISIDRALEAVASGTAALPEYELVFRREIQFRRLFYISHLDVILNRSLSDCGCCTNAVSVIACHPGAELSSAMKIALFACCSAVVEDWNGNHAFKYMLRGLPFPPSDEWVECRASIAIDLLAISPQGSLDIPPGAFDAAELRADLWERKGDEWAFSDAVVVAQERLRSYDIADHQQVWAQAWLEHGDARPPCQCK